MTDDTTFQIGLVRARRVIGTGGRHDLVPHDVRLSLPVVRAGDLGRAFGTGPADRVLEYRGLRVDYAGRTPGEACPESWAARISQPEVPPVPPRSRPRPGEVPVDDGHAALRDWVARMEASTIVVDGWVARLVHPPSVTVRIDGHGEPAWIDAGEVDARMPWMSFPASDTVGAMAFADALPMEAGTGDRDILPPSKVPPVDDPAAAARMASAWMDGYWRRCALAALKATERVAGHRPQEILAAAASGDGAGNRRAMAWIAADALCGGMGRVRPAHRAGLRNALLALEVRLGMAPAA